MNARGVGLILGTCAVLAVTGGARAARAGDAMSAPPDSLAEGKRLLARAAEATGGSAAWAAIRDITEDADLVVQAQGMSIPVGVRSVRTSGDRDYVSRAFPFGLVVMARTGDAGWSKTPKGLEDLSADDVADLRKDRARDFWSLFSHPERYQAAARPGETVDSTACDVVRVTGAGMDGVTVYLDHATGRPARIVYPGKSPEGQPATITETYADYRAAGDLQIPRSVRVLVDGKPFAVGKVNSVTVNAGVDAKLFERPSS